jgi:integrase
LKGPINLVRKVLQAAHEAVQIADVPRGPKLFKSSRKLPNTHTDDEVQQLMAQATNWLRAAVDLASFRGLRLGEVQVMQVQDVDLKANRP